MLQQVLNLWPYLVAGLDLVVSLAASGHAVLHKRDERASIAWVAVIWLVPFVGAFLYALFGINRIRRRAQSLRTDQPQTETAAETCACSPELARDRLGEDKAHLEGLIRLVEGVTDRPLLYGNRVEPLKNGDEAYPAMLEAIGAAQRSISLASYIFSNDRAGRPFVAALGDAVSRGVEVRVLLDDVGRRYGWRPVVRALEACDVRVARFVPTLVPWRAPYANLRNHRKILVVDGSIGFTGGLNIREQNCLRLKTKRPVQDLHFRVAGPTVAHLQETFAADWAFCTGEILDSDHWFPSLSSEGSVLARGIPDGPDEDLDKLRWAILGAIASAKASITVVSPYFLPDSALISALNVAAMRGVKVTILLPENVNIPVVQWASTALWWQLLERGCRIWQSPSPFDHAKLLLMDSTWILLGSANWDARSLRLNFEFNLECYDRDLGAELTEVVRIRMENAREVTLRDVQGRGLPTKLRDGVSRLLSPYL